jgi:hypothetical protein
MKSKGTLDSLAPTCEGNVSHELFSVMYGIEKSSEAQQCDVTTKLVKQGRGMVREPQFAIPSICISVAT